MIKKKHFPIVALMLSASPFILAQEVQPAAKSGAQAEAPAPDDIQKVVIVSTGSRGTQRSMVDTAVPIDILGSRELTKTGQVTLDKSMQFRVPSFNTVQTPVNDATSLLDPYEIRNMGPSRALILINGKRKNSSALIYTQTSPGRGESGADISAIPTDAIKRIEVLRDGASAQYGSDAIAGVVNIILKDNAEGGSATVRAGMTGERDGKMGGLSLNQGLALGDRGFINYTLEASKVGLAQRSGTVSARGEAMTFSDATGPGGTQTKADIDAVLPGINSFLAKYPDARNINGAPATKAAKGLVNMRYDLDGNVSFYGNAAYVAKKVDSYANYRTPYWRPTDYGLLHPAGQPYEGYVPDFIGNLDDYNATGGFKFMIGDWNADVSLTYGGNEQSYGVHNSVNRGMENAILDHTGTQHSPTSFDAGGVKFSHWVLNADVSKQMTKEVNFYAGTEIRRERYEVVAGDEPSYILGGADSYAGNDPRNSFPSTRNNYGIYFGSSWDVTSDFLLDGTVRYEKYSDFGSATVGKLASRYKIDPTLTLRASASTGFRAPSLAQIYTQKAQYSFVAGQGIQVSGLVNNVSKEAAALGVDRLKAEKSTNFTLGLGWKPDNDTSVTVDYYNIAVKDRIIFGNDIKPTGNPANALDQTMKALGVIKVAFFVNAVDSKTSGLDYVLSRKNIDMAGGKMTLNLSGNYTLNNERDGAVHTPAGIAATGQSVLNDTQEALMFTSRPKFKTILGADLDYKDFNFSLNNTVFGPTKFRNDGMSNDLEVEFKTKTVTDFAFNYNIQKNLTLSFNINNLFNVTPEWNFKARNAAGEALLNSTTLDPVLGMTQRDIQWNLVTFDGRYSMVTYDGSHFSQLGRTFQMALNWRF